MALPKFVHLLRDVLRRLGPASSDVQSVCRCSLRRLLPTVAEVCRCPDSLALHLGNWVESVNLKHVPAKQRGMRQHYADDKVATAADSKSKLLQLLHIASRQKGTESLQWQDLRNMDIAWDKHCAAPLSLPESEVLQSAEDASPSSSSESSSSSEAPVPVHWFRLGGPRAVVHLHRANTIDLIPV